MKYKDIPMNENGNSDVSKLRKQVVDIINKLDKNYTENKESLKEMNDFSNQLSVMIDMDEGINFKTKKSYKDNMKYVLKETVKIQKDNERIRSQNMALKGKLLFITGTK